MTEHKSKKTTTSKSMSELRTQLYKVKQMKKPMVDTSELSRTINKMNKEIKFQIQNFLREDICYEYGHEENIVSHIQITEQIISLLPGVIQNTTYEFIRDLIIRDKTMVDEYDRLQDKIGELEHNVRMEMVKEDVEREWNRIQMEVN